MVTRVGYSTQKPDVSALYPADGKLNLPPDKYSDGLRRRVAEEAAKVSFSETSSTIAATTGGAVGQRQCEEVTVKVASDFEEFYAQRSLNQPAATNDLLVLTSDGKGIVMPSEDLREATAQAAQKSSSARKTRLSPGHGAKRMATVASVYHVPRYQRRAEDIIGDQRDPQQQQDWVVLVDGEVHQLKTIKAMAQKQGIELTIVLDFIHVLEDLWKAAYCFCPSGSETAEAWVQERALPILHGLASDVAAGIRRSATLQKLSPKTRENADKRLFIEVSRAFAL